MSRPLVSIIIPTYNRAYQVHQAIESALQQTYPNTEILVVDDGSVDDTAKVVSAYDRVRYIPQVHAGQAVARNNGLKHASGTYIASLDSDDKWEPDFLSICIDKIESGNYDFVFANWMQAMPGGTYIDRQDICDILKNYIPAVNNNWLELDSQQLRNIYLTGCPSPSSSTVLRASAIVNGWTNNLNIADDWCMLMDIIFSKKANAAFTTLLLWTKNVDGSNIYDGRSKHEVVKYLWAEDYSAIYKRFRHNFSLKEKKDFRKRLAGDIATCAYYEIKFHKKVFKGLLFLKQAIAMDTFRVLSLMTKKSIKTTTNLFKRNSAKYTQLR